MIKPMSSRLHVGSKALFDGKLGGLYIILQSSLVGDASMLERVDQRSV
jgi:hypothetical protein